MNDYLGIYAFAKIEFVPTALDRQHQVVSHSGVDGVTIFDSGQRADQQTLRCLGYATSYALARGAVDSVKALEAADPVAVTISGIAATGVLYQVLRVRPLECRRLVWGRGPGGLYYARFQLEVLVQPVAVA
jgi:hypothetical protein